MRKKLPTPKLGDTVGGVEIIGPGKSDGSNDLIFPIRYGCCGNESTLTGRSIRARERRGTNKCLSCRNLERAQSQIVNTIYRPGDRVAGVEILSVVQRARAVTTIRYDARYECCGRREWIAYYSLDQRIRRNRTQCQKCAVTQSVAPTEEDLFAPNLRHDPDLASFWEGPRWPVPGTKTITNEA